MMHDGMTFDPIQGQGHVTSEVAESTILKSISSVIFDAIRQMTADSYISVQYLKSLRPEF